MDKSTTEKVWLAFRIFVWTIGMLGWGNLWGRSEGTRDAMKGAFDRGHAVQCPGVTGYHWECDNDQ